MNTRAITVPHESMEVERKRWCHLSYECPACRMIWHDHWDVPVHGDCPNCGAENIEPQDVVDLSR